MQLESMTLPSSCFTGASCGKGSWMLFLYDYTEHCPVFLPEIVVHSPTGCEKVNFKKQMYDLSEDEKNLLEKM